MWESILEQGERTPSHKHDDRFSALEGSTRELFHAEGRTLGPFEARPAGVFSLKLDGDGPVTDDEKGLRVSATHSTRNLGSGLCLKIFVEKKK